MEWVVGSLWKQRFLVRNSITGNHQFLDKQWNWMSKQWEPYGQRNDWETQCATCHATGYRMLAYDPNNPTAQKMSMVERNTGCEACHGPGAKHVKTAAKSDIFNPAGASKAEASKVCGYCHVRKENYNFRTAQGNPREDQPHPIVGQTYKAGQDDWTKWYPDKMLIPGVNPAQPLDRNYPKTDLENAFFIDDVAKKTGVFDARKHHQQYQEHLQSSHAKKNATGCADCHSPHAVAGKPLINPRETRKECHGDRYDVDKVMPGLASTAVNLFVRSHTFSKSQSRPSGRVVSGVPEYHR